MKGVRRFFSRGVNVLMFARAAPFYARYTVRHHIPAEVLIGLYSGVFLLADFLTRKTLGAPKWMLAVQSSVPVMALILAMVWRDLLEGQRRSRVLLLTGLLGKGMLVSVAFISSPGPFLMVVILLAVMDSAFIPLRNTIFRANYPRSVRGRLFGGVVALQSLAMVGVNLAAAWCLDHWSWTYRILFPAAGIVGFGAHVIYARVRVRGESPRQQAKLPPLVRGAAGSLGRALRTTVRILREDKAFRRYEANFFLYGLAFLMNLPLVVLLMADQLDLAYSQASLARYVMPPVLMILFSPFLGRFLDRSHPTTMMAGAGALLAFHTVLLYFTEGFWMLFASYCAFGIAMSAVNLAWNLGPVQFARSERESADYMAVHVTLTGLRAMLAPVLALGAEQLLGLRLGFAIAAGLYVVSAAGMLALARSMGPFSTEA